MTQLSESPKAATLARTRPQFGLRTLMLAVTLCSVLFAITAALGALWSLTLGFFVALVLAHVAGNALGTQLRDTASRQPAADESSGRRFDAAQPPVPTARRLRERTGVGRGMLVIAGGGALSGGALGGFGMAELFGAGAGLPAFGLGIFSAAVLGGFFAFLTCSFCCVFSRAMCEALGDPSAQPAAVPARR